jgi:hypothetical protein
MRMSNEIQVFDTPDKIEAFRLLSIHGRLKLELKGIKFRQTHRSSTFAHVRKEFGFKGRNIAVFEQYENMLRKKGILK